jgi:hypothetical protein
MGRDYLQIKSRLGVTEPPPTKVEGISGLERLRRTVGPFPTEVGGFKPDFWKMKYLHDISDEYFIHCFGYVPTRPQLPVISLGVCSADFKHNADIR